MLEQCQYDPEHQVILLTFKQLPYWDQFVADAQTLLVELTGETPVDVASGMDKHIIHFHFDNCLFSLNYEEYSGSCWIELADEGQEENIINLTRRIKSYCKLD
ncbi:DUF3630 family protein [Flocculibacter collagenilyticus]|uniref:DUF3630 family protein n=1 Tax=Flocculibacter collagenilyticus TaxID=2744479 RepID=UPI0018F659D2|nr:DUF3630 family protein [Flocculibacter collagenilyticus]